VPTRGKVTLSEVAARAGVSPTTASYILNGRSAEMRISNGAQERVRQAVVDLAYRPNRSARTLRGSKTKTIGLISDHVASGRFASQMLTGASAAARKTDHLLVIGETEGDLLLETQLIEELSDRDVDGIIYATLVARRIVLPESLETQNVVLLNCFDPDRPVPSVLPDDLGGGRTAARKLLDGGAAEVVGVVGHDPDVTALAGPRRLEGITAELGAAGESVAALVRCDWDVHAAHEAVGTWLATGPTPTGLICLNDRIAMGTYQALADHGLQVPDDVAVVSFDGSDLATWLRPPVTSVALPLAELGAAAVRLLTGEEPVGDQPLQVPMQVRRGASVVVPQTMAARSGGDGV
jgi:LacI family transcriptional regulator, galactose operon repressor